MARAYTMATFGSATLDEIVDIIHDIYQDKDELRPLWDVWLHTHHHAAEIAQHLRLVPSVSEDLLIEIADFTVWLFTVVGKLRRPVGRTKTEHETNQETVVWIKHSCADVLWNRYPRLCPRCYSRARALSVSDSEAIRSSAACECVKSTLIPLATDASLPLVDGAVASKPSGIDSWQEMFAHIYAASLCRFPLEAIALHLLEDLGKASDAIVRMYTYREESFRPGELKQRQTRLQNTIADVFCWLFVLVTRLDALASADDSTRSSAVSEVKLSSIIWRRYGSDPNRSLCCPHGGVPQPRCTCPLIFVGVNREATELLRLLSA